MWFHEGSDSSTSDLGINTGFVADVEHRLRADAEGVFDSVCPGVGELAGVSDAAAIGPVTVAFYVGVGIFWFVFVGVDFIVGVGIMWVWFGVAGDAGVWVRLWFWWGPWVGFEFWVGVWPCVGAGPCLGPWIGVSPWLVFEFGVGFGVGVGVVLGSWVVFGVGPRVGVGVAVGVGAWSISSPVLVCVHEPLPLSSCY